MSITRLLFILPLFILLCSCNSKQEKIPKAKKVALESPLIIQNSNENRLLSQYDFFSGNLSDLEPNEDVFPYTLNTPLFSNYAYKKRFVYLPNGNQMTYSSDEVFSFENGTILIKNFYYPEDFRIKDGPKKIIETRLLIKEKDDWKALNYVWRDNQKDADLNYIGKKLNISWTHTDGIKKSTVYNVPNNNQCKDCHINGKDISPIGPTAAQLNRKYNMVSNQINQLEFYDKKGLLKNLPDHGNLPKFAVWDNEQSGSIEDRAKAYLDINCAHCHQPQGSAKNSGLDLRLIQTNRRKQGIFKPPIAAGKGSGDLQYSIVPGSPEESIIIYRMRSTDPGVMMPEIGRSIAHQEGIELISEYIKNLKVNISY